MTREAEGTFKLRLGLKNQPPFPPVSPPARASRIAMMDGPSFHREGSEAGSLCSKLKVGRPPPESEPAVSQRDYSAGPIDTVILGYQDFSGTTAKLS